MMDSADPYSDGILKMPIVIDNVSISAHYYHITLIFRRDLMFVCVGLRTNKGWFQWRGEASKDIQLLVSLINPI